MSNKKENRVLGRTGARQLAENETDRVAGGFIPTLLSVIITGSHTNPDQRLDS